MSDGYEFPEFDGDEPCATLDPELYFPDDFYGQTRKTKRVMESLCRSCHSRAACLTWAVKHEVDGYWAGTNPHTRKKLRRELGVTLRIVTVPITQRREVA